MMRIAVQMDAPESLNPAGDSTIVLLREAARRGAEIYYYHATTLQCIDGTVSAPLARLHIAADDAAEWYSLELPEIRALEEMDVVLMRQDPPFDMSYITATYMLDQLPKSTLVLNNPTAVRSHSEKFLPLDYVDAMPPTLISPHEEELLAFLEMHGDIIIKPLYGWGGHAVLRLRSDGDNTLALLELIKRFDRQPLIAQPFLKEVAQEDVRVVLIGGTIAGAFARIPTSGEVRANMRVGGTPQPYQLNAEQQALCERAANELHQKGLYLAGLDLIGPYLTEINVTSPTGLRTLEQLYGSNPAALFWDGVKTLRSSL